jgi:hypothetical protein
MTTRLTPEQIEAIDACGCAVPCDVEGIDGSAAVRSKLVAEIRLLQRDLKDARKENAYLLDRNVRLVAAALKYVDDDTIVSLQQLIALLNEVPK